MKPISISEQLLYNTVRLECTDGSSGTGFFFNFKFGEYIVPAIVTNKHVVNNNPDEPMKFLLHLREGNEASQDNFDVTFHSKWIFHPTHDICCTLVNPLFQEVKERTGKEVFYIANEETLIYDISKLNELAALEEVVMVGYPNGLWDATHNYPIFRKGFTAAHPGYDFNEKSIGLVDMACFPGSSGSPIYILDENGYSDKQGNTYLGAKRIIFLGILFAGPTMSIEGDINVIDIPMKQKIYTSAQTMINLGYYVKAHEIKELKKIIEPLIRCQIR
ncbi:serine protease [Clostridium sp. chh4-2]|uniref:S1 family peptidase n=1 Tax=Clostridium sp. chh4-2 TaxID=2067550 RepID=UPI000CCF4760|nr:serine protease [Clostridium sp. chh4-2]PNV62803.1 serine protease [Clostridium sp. chh4-2]